MEVVVVALTASHDQLQQEQKSDAQKAGHHSSVVLTAAHGQRHHWSVLVPVWL